MDTSQAYSLLIRRGTPGTFFEHIDVTDEDALRRIASFSKSELREHNITQAQQDILNEFLESWEYRKKVMSDIEKEIDQIQLEMREIRLGGIDFADDQPLTSEKKALLALLNESENRKRTEIDRIRRDVENQLVGLDQQMGETFTKTHL